MKKVIAVFGYGPGISQAVANRFGGEGFAVALVSRNQERLQAGVQDLSGRGIEAAAFRADAGQPADIRRVLGEVRAKLGPVTAIEWTAYGSGAGDLTTAPESELRGTFDVAVVGLVTAIQAALPDLKSTGGAVLIANGGLGFFDPQIDKAGVEWNAMGLSMANSAKHKLAGLLAYKLKADGIHVGEVVVNGSVKGSAWDTGSANVDPAAVAQAFWQLYSSRDQHSVTIG